MGAGVSAGKNNDDLVENLKDADYIKTSTVERVFRAVDRGEYFLADPAANPYRDVAWKNGNFHISAPCIYSEVMEGLKLEPGLSFLNLGSGTGYLSTMAGLILGHNGINHGIELHDDVIQYANKKLEEFKRFSGALDEFDFCEPKFVQGNCLCLGSGGYLYDRVYCGAGCPEQYLNYMKNLIKVGGILIVPLNDQLLEMTRTSETNWHVRCLLPVSFATLVQPVEGSSEVARLPDIEALTLQELTRMKIRNLLRKSIEEEHPLVKPAPQLKRRKGLKKRKAMKKEANRSHSSPRPARNDDNNRDSASSEPHQNYFTSYFLSNVRSNIRRSSNSTSNGTGTSREHSSSEHDNTTGPHQVRAVIEHEPSSDEDEDNDDDDEVAMSDDEKLDRVHEAFWDILRALGRREPHANLAVRERASRDGVYTDGSSDPNSEAETDKADLESNSEMRETETVEATTARDDTQEMNTCNAVIEKEQSRAMSAGVSRVTVEINDDCNKKSQSNSIKDESDNGILEKMNAEDVSPEVPVESAKSSSSTTEQTPPQAPVCLDEGVVNEIVGNQRPHNRTDEIASCSAVHPEKSNSNRQKLDSGLGDEIISSSPPVDSVDDWVDITSSSDEDLDTRRCKRSFIQKLEKRANSKWRRLDGSHMFDSSDNETDSVKSTENARRMYKSFYSIHMENRIRKLPLPSILKKYLHFYREL